MTTVETLVKVRGDTSHFQSVLTGASKATDRFFDSFKKRRDKLERLKISPRISTIDNVTDTLQRIEQLSDKLKSLASMKVSVNVALVKQALPEADGSTTKLVKAVNNQEEQDSKENIVKPSQEASSTNNRATTAAYSAAAVILSAPAVLAHDSWENSRNPQPPNPTETSFFKKMLPKLAKGAAKAFAPLNIAEGIVSVVQSDNKGRASAELVGGLAGQALGFLGGPVGSLAGYALGRWGGGFLYDTFWGKEDAKAAEKGNAILEQQNIQVADAKQVVPDQQESKTYLDSQKKIITSNELISASQKNLGQNFSNLAQVAGFARDGLNAFASVNILTRLSQSNDNNDTSKYAASAIASSPQAGPKAIPLSEQIHSQVWQQEGEYLGVRPSVVRDMVGLVSDSVVAGGGVKVTVPVNVNLQVSSNNIDYETITDQVSRELTKGIKKAMENKVA